MPRLVTVRRPAEVAQQAQEYVKSYILFPSGLVGFICLIGGVGGLGYQFMATDTYTWGTFYQSSALIILGVVVGLAQTRYHQFVLRRFPEILAGRMRVAAIKRGARAKKETQPPSIDHAGRKFVPVAYVLGTLLLLGSAFVAALYGQVSAISAVLMPWAGFHWARIFFWRSAMK